MTNACKHCGHKDIFHFKEKQCYIVVPAGFLKTNCHCEKFEL